MSNKVKTLTLNSYMDKYGADKVASLYVVNMTSKPKGNIAFNSVDEMNRAACVFIPATFIPVDLTEIVTREGLLANKDFKRNLSVGRLVIVDNESVANYFANNKTAQAELRRIQGMTDSAEELAPVEDGSEIELIGSKKSKAKMVDADEIALDGKESMEGVFVSAFISRCGAESTDSDDTLVAEFLQRGIGLPKEDLQYMLDNITREAVREIILEAME